MLYEEKMLVQHFLLFPQYFQETFSSRASKSRHYFKYRYNSTAIRTFTGFAPKIEIETSTFGDDWHKMLQNPQHCDVTFLVEGKHILNAHSLVLCSASKLFAKILGVSKPMTVSK